MTNTCLPVLWHPENVSTTVATHPKFMDSHNFHRSCSHPGSLSWHRLWLYGVVWCHQPLEELLLLPPSSLAHVNYCNDSDNLLLFLISAIQSSPLNYIICRGLDWMALLLQLLVFMLTPLFHTALGGRESHWHFCSPWLVAPQNGHPVKSLLWEEGRYIKLNGSPYMSLNFVFLILALFPSHWRYHHR